MRKEIKISFLIVVVSIFLGFAIAKTSVRSPLSALIFGSKHISLESSVTEIISRCSQARSKSACYDEEMPKLIMAGFSLEETFAAINLLQQKDKVYTNCHVAAHRIVAAERARNPDEGLEIINRCPRFREGILCTHGCLHEVVQGNFDKETLTEEEILGFLPKVEEICLKRNTFLDKANCYHGIGHLLAYSAGENTSLALEFCNMLKPTFQKQCYEGIFMSIFHPSLKEERSATEKIIPPREEAWEFCSKFAGIKQESCWSEAWPLFEEEIKTPGGFAVFCAKLKDLSGQENCYRSVMHMVTVLLEFDTARILSFCSALPKELIGGCFSSAAAYMVYMNNNLLSDAQKLCEEAASWGKRAQCFERLLLQGYLQSAPFPPF